MSSGDEGAQRPKSPSGSDLPSWRRRKIVVTGIAGRLGRVVARRLHRDPRFVIEGLDRRDFPERPKDIAHHQVSGINRDQTIIAHHRHMGRRKIF